jgi:hypothetical protein
MSKMLSAIGYKGMILRPKYLATVADLVTELSKLDQNMVIVSTYEDIYGSIDTTTITIDTETYTEPVYVIDVEGI